MLEKKKVSTNNGEKITKSSKSVLSVYRQTWFLLLHLLPQYTFYVTVFDIFRCCFNKKEKFIIFSKRRSFCFVLSVDLSLMHCDFYHLLVINVVLFLLFLLMT